MQARPLATADFLMQLRMQAASADANDSQRSAVDVLCGCCGWMSAAQQLNIVRTKLQQRDHEAQPTSIADVIRTTSAAHWPVLH
mmetsp:Transcript_120656/g.352375  ORF Transcript_120656/g.352375 Transcript_120656/m.352375 type:complete len:84 (+) Transcript_120656:117-368(+)